MKIETNMNSDDSKLITENKHSVELSRGMKGQYGWKIKLYEY